MKFKELFDNSGTDKSRHGYGMAYDLIMKSLPSPKGKLSLLEIGVWKGRSLQAWANSEYFAKIVGIDIKNIIDDDILSDINTHCVCSIIEGNGYTPNTINAILEEFGKFDIIIDDGSHNIQHQLMFFDKYAPLVKSGGLMVCEDVKAPLLDRFSAITSEFDLYTLDLRNNVHNHINKFDDDILILRYIE